MITVVVSGSEPSHFRPKIAKIIADCLIGSRHVVRFFPKGKPDSFIDDENVINVIDETTEVKV